MNAWVVRGWLAFAFVLAMLYAGWTLYRVERAQASALVENAAAASSNTSNQNRRVADFTLTDQAGQPFGTEQLRGKVWVASFFFASCPATCRQLNTSLAAVQRDVPADAMFVSITCDPDNDDPPTLTRYGKLFNADFERWKFLTGDMQDLKRIGENIFQVALAKGTHSEKSFVVDRSGRIRGHFNMLDPEQVKKLKSLLEKLDAEPANDNGSQTEESSPRKPEDTPPQADGPGSAQSSTGGPTHCSADLLPPYRSLRVVRGTLAAERAA